MIKKIFSIFAIAFISISSVFADESAWNIFTVGNDFTEYPDNTSYTFKPLSSSSFLTYGMAQAKAIALIPMRYNASNFNMLIYRNKNHQLSRVANSPGYTTCNGTNNVCVGTFTTATLYNKTNRANLTNGTQINLAGYYTNDQLDGQMTRFAIKKRGNSYIDNGAFCMIYDNINTAICLKELNANPYIINNGTKNTEAGLTNDPTNFDTSFIGTSPRTTTSTLVPGQGTNMQNNGNYCPTVADLMTKYPINYNTGACYSTIFSFSGGSITSTKKTIFETFSSKDELNEYIQLYSLNCKAPNTQEQCQTAFSGKQDKYSIVDTMNNNGLYPDQLWQYCNLGLNYSPNTTTCVGSGVLNQGAPTREQIVEALTNGEFNINIPGENSVINQACPDDDPNCMNKGTRDVFGSLSSIYNKITNLFKTRSGVNGIIPDYILRIAFLIILFTILFKK